MAGFFRVDNRRIFSMDAPRDTAGQLKILNDKIGDFLSPYDDSTPASEIDPEDLNEALYRSELFAVSCRNAMEEDERNDADLMNSDSLMLSEDVPAEIVSVNYFDHLLQIETPLTFFRFTKTKKDPRNYMIGTYIKAGIIKWQKEHQFDLSEAMDPPLVCAIIRHSPDSKIRRLCDNDNLENGRIVNEIVNALGQSDNPAVLDLISCVRPAEKKGRYGMEFLVFPRSEINKRISLIYPESVGSTIEPSGRKTV